MGTYLELEASKHSSRPREGYQFVRGVDQWLYTTFQKPITIDGVSYAPLAGLQRGQIDVGGKDKPGTLSVTLPVASALGADILGGASAQPIQLKILRVQKNAGGAPAIIFIGEFSAVDISEEAIAIQALPFTAALGITVPQGLYQRDQCAWNTYDPLTCGVDEDTFTFTGTVSAIDGTSVTVDGASLFDPGTGTAADMFALGILKKGNWRGMIEQQVGDLLILQETVPTLAVGNTVQLVAGDNRSLYTCRHKFNNARRRMAFQDMPTLNPAYGQGLNP